MKNLEWLTARPFAHRGLHDKSQRRVENCAASFAAAIAHGFAIECDVQLSADGEAMVFHDETVDRLMKSKGRLLEFTTRQLQEMDYRDGDDRMQSLGELLAQVDGRTTLLIEIKSLNDGDMRLVQRVLEVVAQYQGNYALMSFDAAVVSYIAAHAPLITHGLTAEADLARLPEQLPDFISIDWRAFPAPAADAFRAAKKPVLCWTVRKAEDATHALRWADQITFEGFIPK